MNLKNVLLIMLSLSVILLISSCNSSSKPENRNAEQVFNDGLKYFGDEDYMKAKQYFELIKLQYPASEFADDAQYYMSELHFARKEYIMAAFTFNNLRKIYPGSEYVQESLYKSALCYYELSPSFERDQDYTKQAIMAFQEFQYIYPNDSLSNEASKKIDDMREKLARKEFYTAQIYRNMDYPRSAEIYFDSVINNYDDTKFIEDAFKGKIEILVYMKKQQKAKEVIQIYKKRFPKGNLFSDISKIESTLE